MTGIAFLVLLLVVLSAVAIARSGGDDWPDGHA